ncbi:MAG: diol dehydratase small subunit [Pseudomonadota bacterium]
MSDISYPVMDSAADRLTTATGKKLSDLTLENVLAGTVTAADFSITREALLLQAEVARLASRRALAENFERASELVGVPNETIFEIYELLRPGRAASAEVLKERARHMRSVHGANRIAAFLEEAAAAYERRSLFRRRY